VSRACGRVRVRRNKITDTLAIHGLEHKGVNNRVLRELGWIKVKGNRDSPRNCESCLAPNEDLVKFRDDLVFLMKEPRTFIKCIFKSNKEEWVDRCSAIIKDG
jgi:hypothetical protein